MSGLESDPSAKEKIKRQQDARNIRELFRGRFTKPEVYKLLKRFNWERQETVEYILEAEPGALRRILNSNDVEERISLVSKDDALKDLAMKNQIETEVRQYGCDDCENMWWRIVPIRKPVSRCTKCKQSYDPFPREKEYGWAAFHCGCGNRFNGWGIMGLTESRCYKCKSLCEVENILPPTKRNRRPKSRKQHSCNAPNCYNKEEPVDRKNICVHPRSKPIKKLGGSKRHSSTGSTVTTFLDQLDLDPPYEPTLDDIVESNDEDDNNCVHPRSKPIKKLGGSKRHSSRGSAVTTFLDQLDLDPPYEPTFDDIVESSDEDDNQ